MDLQYKQLLPQKFLIAIMNQMNWKLKDHFKSDDKQLKKKLYKLNNFYEYFHVKIFMGYLKMPKFLDYFDDSQPYQAPIMKHVNKARCSVIEFNTEFDDLNLLQKGDVNQYYRINKKFNKILIAHTIKDGAQLYLIQSPIFKIDDIINIILIDLNSQCVVSSIFCQEQIIQESLLQLFELLKNRQILIFINENLIQFHQDELQGFEQMYHIQFAGYMRNSGAMEIEETLPLDDKLLFFGNNNSQNQYKKINLKFPFFYHNLRNEFSYQSKSTGIMNEINEICIWNAFIINKSTSYEDFRIQLIELLLKDQLTECQSEYKEIPFPRVKQSTQETQTNTTMDYGEYDKKGQQSKFHIPNKIEKYIKQVCIVCRKFSTDLVQCQSCTNLSYKYVVLCASSCFVKFHQNTHQYIQWAEDTVIY
ncbi:hypothetical protein pb186bvf_012793 [Paramecium bursaria]